MTVGWANPETMHELLKEYKLVVYPPSPYAQEKLKREEGERSRVASLRNTATTAFSSPERTPAAAAAAPTTTITNAKKE